jgi:hypothetical protein
VAEAVCAISRNAARKGRVRKRLIEPRLYTKKLQRSGGVRGVSGPKRASRSAVARLHSYGSEYRDAMDR